MAEEKKRRGRRAHLNDFYRDVSGSYIYTGTCYVCTAAPQERTALLRRLWLLAAVMAVSVVTGGCIPAPGMGGSFYLLLPYVAEVGLTGSVVWAMTRWQAREYPMRAYVYKARSRPCRAAAWRRLFWPVWVRRRRSYTCCCPAQADTASWRRCICC